MRIFITGWDGLLGRSVVPLLRAAHEVDGFGVADGDVADRAFLAARTAAFAPDRILHLAAYTAVDRCETERAEAFRVNEDGSRAVGEIAAARGIPVLGISTDYVFDGRLARPYREDDATGPLSVYGASKLAGERALAASGAPWAVVRTAWLYGPGGGNFVDTILNLLGERETLSVVDDQHGCPTYTADLAAALVRLLERDARGVYHVAGAGATTWCGFARAAVDAAGGDPERIRPATTAEIARPAPRPAYSVLDCGKAAADHGVTLPPWRDAAARYVAERARRRGENAS